MVLAIEREPRQRRQWARVVARAWDDDAFRQRLLAEPEAVLREAGIALPNGVPVRVLEDNAAADADPGACLRLPAKPAADDLIEDDLGLPQNAPNGGLAPCRHCNCRCGGCVTALSGRGRSTE